MKDSSEKKMQEMASRIKELEAALGRKQIQVEYFEKMIELAKTELDIDIKKTTAPHNHMVQGKQKTNKFFYESTL
ncbi:hypothetical protein VS868_06025 [Salinimicrobium sp. 3283s]|uniref:hypothetical protein n=1 Tax=Salinimicrobium sp. 3283s TaxID=3114359 RepID=UPI0031EFF54A